MKTNIIIKTLTICALCVFIAGCSWFTLGRNNPLDPLYSGAAGSSSSSGSIAGSFIYVATFGNDTNDGSAGSPLLTIQAAVNKAAALGKNVLVAQGTYTPGGGLNNSGSGVLVTNHNIKIIGVWDSNFTGKTGYSVLDGATLVFHVIAVKNGATNFWLEGMRVTGGLANSGTGPDGCGGGIYLSGTNCFITNCVLTNNKATNGGGLCVDGGIGHKINIVSMFNTAFNLGGGLYITNSRNNTITGQASNNTANNFGGGLYAVNTTNDNYNLNAVKNTANTNGGGYFIDRCYNVTVNSNTSDNKATYGDGGGLYITNSDTLTINTFIFRNYCNGTHGGGIALTRSTYCSIYGNVILNTNYNINTGLGGGIYIKFGNYNTVSGNILTNFCSNIGGGMCLDNTTNVTISGNVMNNNATINFAGINEIATVGTSITGTVGPNP